MNLLLAKLNAYGFDKTSLTMIINTRVHGAAKQGTSTQERHWLGAHCTKWTRSGKANLMRNSKSRFSEQERNQFSYIVKPGHSHGRKVPHWHLHKNAQNDQKHLLRRQNYQQRAVWQPQQCCSCR